MPVETEKSPVGIPCLGYEEMSELWVLLHDLLGGTPAMQRARQTWLPIEPAEDSTAYNSRLNRSILYNGYRDTKNKLKNRPFTRSIVVTDLPSELAYLENDVDGSGKSLETFLKEVLENLIKYGIAHIFVDHSIVDDVIEGKEITKRDEKELGIRVYLNNVSPYNLIGWQTQKTNKAVELTQIRIKETITEASEKYGDKEACYITVYNRENYEIHKQDIDNKDLFFKVKEGNYSFGRIPLVTIYTAKKGIMMAEPPLDDLAWLNLAHWQSYSDQRNILRFTRFGIIFGKGLPDKMVEMGTLQLGPTKAYLVTDKDADMKYVEHSGKSIEAGQKDIEDIEQKMRVLGNQPLMKNLPNTATAEKIDEDRTVSQLQSWVRALVRGIRQALELACEWRKIDPPEDMGIEIYSDFEAVVLGGADKGHILKARQSGEITRERYLREAQRRGVYSEDMDPEEEAAAAGAEETNDLESLLPEEKEIEDEELEEEDEE